MSIDEIKSKADDVADILKTMAHPERLLVLCQLIEGEMGAGLLQESSSLSQSAFSQHLSVLRKKNLVSIRKESQMIFYQLADPRVAQLIASLHQVFCTENQENTNL